MALQKKGWNWCPLPIGVITSKALYDFDVRLYGYLLWRAGRKGSAWPGVDRIAKEFGVDRRTVTRALTRLVGDFWINRFRRFGRSAITRVYESQDVCKAERAAPPDEWDTKVPFEQASEWDTKVPSNGTPKSPLNESKRNERKLSASGAQKSARQPTPFQLECKRLESLFSKKTNLPAPEWDKATPKQKKALAVRWANPIAGFIKLANGRSLEILEAAIDYQRAQHWPISAPQSIEKSFQHVWSETTTSGARTTPELT